MAPGSAPTSPWRLPSDTSSAGVGPMFVMVSLPLTLRVPR